MIATINGHLVEGTLEEIAKLLGIELEYNNSTISDSNTIHIHTQFLPTEIDHND